MKKILIAVPCMDQVPVPFCNSLARLIKPEGFQSSLVMRVGSLIYVAREQIALYALEGEFDYVFWLDSDMVFQPDVLVRMLETLEQMDIDILSGLYFRRVPPYSPVIFDRLEMVTTEESQTPVCEWSDFKKIPTDLFEVGGAGFGCLLMRTDVFFGVQAKFDHMFEPIGSNGEDVAFCWRARKCGYKIWCDPGVICGHVGYSTVDDKFFRAFSEKK